MGGRKIERDADGFRVPVKKSKEEVVQKNAELASGLVVDVFSKHGNSWWRDQDGKVRALAKYETPEQLVEAIEDWEQKVLDKIKAGDDFIPDAEALAVALDVSRSTLMNWEKGTRGEEFKNIVEIEMNKIAMIKNQMAMKGQIPPMVWIAMMNNNHGYVQKQDFNVDITARREPMKAEELINQANLLPG